MRTSFDPATTIRLRPEIREQIKRLAEREGNSDSAVIRRALAAGLDLIGDQKNTGSPDSRPAA